MTEPNNLPIPPSEDPSKTSFDEETLKEALDLTNNETSVSTKENEDDEKEDKIVKELTKPDKVQKEETEVKEENYEKVEKVADSGESPNEIEELRKQLALYQTLFGDSPQNQQTQQHQQQHDNQQQNNQQQIQQQQSNILDAVNVTQDELLGLLSGEPERAVPVIKKFIATAIILAQHNTAQQQQLQERESRYISGVQEAFYERYKELKEDRFRPIVKYAGDQIHQEYLSRGITKYPHELIDDIGKRAVELKNQLLAQANGGTNNPTNGKPKQVIKQGEVGGTKVTPPPKVQLTEEQNQMYDLLEQ